MKFYVIYSVDCADKNLTPSIDAWRPSKGLRTKLTKTEGNEEYGYDYLGDDWIGGSHFKYTGILTKEEFRAFLNQTSLVFEDVETMGSLTEYGWMPALAYNIDSIYGNVIGSCYVTPMPEVSDGFNYTNEEIEDLPKDFRELLFKCIGEKQSRDWKRIAKAMKSVFPY